MAPRERQHRKVGVMRMDAALDAMRQLGFRKNLVRKTVQELLKVYEGTQGWPFIEEASYKLLIETLLSKQQSSASADDEDNGRRDGVAETSSAATPTTGITEVGSSGLVAPETVLHTSNGLDSVFKTNHQDSASQTNGQDSASLGNPGTDAKDLPVEAGREGHGQCISLRKPADTEMDKTPVIKSLEPFDPLPCRRSKGYLGWLGSDDDVEHYRFPHIRFPLRPLSEQIKKLIGHCEAPQSGRRRRRKSRWDEKPDDM